MPRHWDLRPAVDDVPDTLWESVVHIVVGVVLTSCLVGFAAWEVAWLTGVPWWVVPGPVLISAVGSAALHEAGAAQPGHDRLVDRYAMLWLATLLGAKAATPLNRGLPRSAGVSVPEASARAGRPGRRSPGRSAAGPRAARLRSGRGAGPTTGRGRRSWAC